MSGRPRESHWGPSERLDRQPHFGALRRVQPVEFRIGKISEHIFVDEYLVSVLKITDYLPSKELQAETKLWKEFILGDLIYKNACS